MKAAAAALVEAGEWTVREGKAGNGHDAEFWSLAPTTEDVSLVIEDPLPVVEEPLPEIEEPLPDGIVKVEGICFARGQQMKPSITRGPSRSPLIL